MILITQSPVKRIQRTSFRKHSKAIITVISIFIIVMMITSCDMNLNNDDLSVGRYSTACFTVVDDLSNSPLDSAYVRLILRSIRNRVYSSLPGVTDASGKCCFEYEPESSLYGLEVAKKGYVSFITDKGYLPTTVRLEPVAYLKLHVINIPPSATNDQIGISYPVANPLPNSNILICEGANVDTTFTVITVPGINWISLISWHNNVRKDSTLNNLAMRSHDTTFVQILY